MKLPNGIIVQESPFPNANDLEICIVNQGAIMDHMRGIVGIQHLIEHKAFTFNDLHMKLNASTTLENMNFLMTEINDVKNMLKVLKMWFGKTDDGYIKLAHNVSLRDIERCIREIDNEYVYRTTSYDLHDLLYYILMGGESMFYCGNCNCFKSAQDIKSAIDSLEYIRPQDVIVVYNPKIDYLLPSIESFFAQFKGQTTKLPKYILPLNEYYGKIIASDTSMYQIMFRFDENLINDLIYVPIFVHNAMITTHTYLDGCFIKIFFDSKQMFQDFLYLVDILLLSDLIPMHIYVDPESFYNFLRVGKVNELYMSSVDFMGVAIPKVEKIFRNIRKLYKKNEFVVLGPYNEFTSIKHTLSGEPVCMQDFELNINNYIYDHSYKKYMLSYVDSDTKWCKQSRTSYCFQPNLEMCSVARLPQKNTTLEDTIKYLVQYILRSAPLNYEIDSKSGDQMMGNEHFDIRFSGTMSTIKTKYDFTLFLMKLEKNALEDFYLYLHTFLYQQKDLGNIYYHKIHFLKFQDYTIMTLFSNPANFDKWKNSMLGFFASCGFDAFYLIQSKKSQVYDLTNLEKKTVVTF